MSSRFDCGLDSCIFYVILGFRSPRNGLVIFLCMNVMI